MLDVIRKGTLLRCKHLRAVADSIQALILDDGDNDGNISIEEVWWWLEQAGMDATKEYTGSKIGEFAFIALSIIHGYIASLEAENV
jgi:hypothetical protein